MFHLLRLAFGAMLLTAGVSGLLYLALAPEGAAQVRVAQLAAATGQIGHTVLPRELQSQPNGTPVEPVEFEGRGAQPVAVDTAVTTAPVTHLQIPSISPAAEVVTARLVRVGQAQTWEVPAFKVGHAEATVGAGEAGNSVLLGHVSSVNAGNVFKDLDRVRVGDAIASHTGDRVFRYRVTEILRVTREDASVLDNTAAPTLTLITCTGTWLPELKDFSHRLVVRAELAPEA